ncbi:MAG: TonB-dependent receptor plug domain-containing protein [Flavobacteriales bacterium]
MIRSSLSFLFILMLSSFAIAQTATLKGRIRDLDGLPAAGVFILQKEFTNNGTATDDMGQFELEVQANFPVVLIFKGIGSEPIEREFQLKAGEVRTFDLVYDNTATAGVITIRSDREGSMKPIETKLATKLPTINAGIESYLLQMPVNFASELSSSYSVRGGSFDENLVYVNGIQVYRPFLVRAGEQEGLTFPNPDMVSNIRFSAGGFAARYGDKMSSVLDVQYARPDSTYGSFTMGLLGGSLHAAGISKSRTFTHNTGVRYKNNSYVFNSLDVQGDYRPRYYDIQSFLTWRPEPYSPLEISFLANYQNNRYQFIPSTRTTDVGNINEALRLTVYFDGKEETRFETVFGALSAKYNLSPSSQVMLTASAFNTFETERFDIQGAYRLDELERDLGSDGFGEVLRNRGVGGFLDHARNELNATAFHSGALVTACVQRGECVK